MDHQCELHRDEVDDPSKVQVERSQLVTSRTRSVVGQIGEFEGDLAVKVV